MATVNFVHEFNQALLAMWPDHKRIVSISQPYCGFRSNVRKESTQPFTHKYMYIGIGGIHSGPYRCSLNLQVFITEREIVPFQY